MTFSDIMPFGMGIEELIALAASAMIAFAVIAIYRSVLERAPAQRRAKAIGERKAQLRQQFTAPKRRSRLDTLGIARQTVERFKLMTGKPVKEAGEKLMRAGFRSRDAITYFLFAKLCMPLVLGTVALICVYVLEMFNLGTQGKLFACMGAILLGFYLPDMYVRNIADKRTKLLTKAMPDMLDLLVMCAEAGLSLDQALVRVAREIRINSAEMADELELTSAELGFMSERRDALNNLQKRTGVKSMLALVNTLGQAERYGTPLAQSLRVLSAELRDERLMRAEEKAARLPATMTVPMMIFIMPTLFIILIGPGIIRVADTLLPAMNR
jgi:tight adherence protein C